MFWYKFSLLIIKKQWLNWLYGCRTRVLFHVMRWNPSYFCRMMFKGLTFSKWVVFWNLKLQLENYIKGTDLLKMDCVLKFEAICMHNNNKHTIKFLKIVSLHTSLRHNFFSFRVVDSWKKKNNNNNNNNNVFFCTFRAHSPWKKRSENTIQAYKVIFF